MPRRRWVRIVLALVVAVVVVIAGYLTYVAVRRSQPVTLPAPTGRYQVGRQMFDWTDRSRIDPVAPRPGMARELSVWVWYPATRPGGTPAPYAPGAWGGLHLSGVASLAESGFGAVRDHSFDGAPVATGRFPVVVLEPGLGLSAPQYTTLAENVASHGYLVAGVTPTYSASLTVLHGQAVTATAAGNPSDLGAAASTFAAGNKLVDEWAADARFAVAQVTVTFAQHVNGGGGTAYFGHSFGGAAALVACSTDTRCAGAVDLDGAQFGDVVTTGTHVPTMIMASATSCVTGTCQNPTGESAAERAHARSLLAASTGPVWCYQINDAQHFNFSDYGAYFLAFPLRNVVPLGSIDGDLALTITNAYLVAFLDNVLHGTGEPLLTSATSPYAQVTVQRHGG
jgi:hypothetical protein